MEGNFCKVLILSFGFFVMFTAFISCQNISSKVIKDLGFENLGFLSIALIYGVFAITSLFSAPINRYFGTKWTLVFSSFTYVLYIMSFLLPCYRFEKEERGEDITAFYYSNTFIKIVYLGASCLCGIGAGPLWVSQANYLAECATEENKGRMNGTFATIF